MQSNIDRFWTDGNRGRALRSASATALMVVTLGWAGVAAAQTTPAPQIPTPIAPSQVTPRSLRPPVPFAPAPVNLEQGTPTEVPAGADEITVQVAQVLVDGDFPEMAATSRRILAPLEGRPVSVGDLYRGSAALEKAYSDAGYFLARVLVVKQRLTGSDGFQIRVIDGFIESIDTKGVPRRVARPVAGLIEPVIGRRHLTYAEMERRLNDASAIPGITLRSTLARGDAVGGAKLILEGRHRLAGLTIGGDNRLGPSFNDWGLNLQGQVNSALGLGEQIYVFLSGSPRIDRAFRRSALRRVGGMGALVPLNFDGLVFNPEFTVSDTHPKPLSPIFATDGRLYRGAMSLSQPLVRSARGTLTGRATLELLSETQQLPFFGVTLSKDRLTVVRAGLAWRGPLWSNASVTADGTVSQGTRLFGARTRTEAALSSTPTSRGSNPQFTDATAQAVVQRGIGARSTLTVIARAQTSFGTVVPSSELFDLAGLDSLSPLTAGALSADGGVSLRGELARVALLAIGGGKLQLAPYVFGAVALPHAVIADPFLPSRATAFGAGIRLATSPLLLGASPNLTLEYGHVNANRGAGSSERLSVLYGVSF